MHVTRLLFILLLSSGLWSSLAAKTALPEVEFAKYQIELPQVEKVSFLPKLISLDEYVQTMVRNCRDYGRGYAAGYCYSQIGDDRCTREDFNRITREATARCEAKQ